MPNGVEETTIGDGVQQYNQLRDLERKLDSAMMRKRLEIGDSLHRSSRKHKTMRIWISNTAENQPWQERGLDSDAFDFATAVDGTYRVKIEGRLIDDDSDDFSEGEDEEEKTDDSRMADVAEKTATGTRKRFSHFFKAIQVEHDKSRSLSPEAPLIEWKKEAAGSADFDSVEFERKGDENMNVTIGLTRAESGERFRLSKSLSEILDTDEEDKMGAVLGIWDYIKAMGLQEDEEKRAVRCDERLRAVCVTCFSSRHG
jgi:SWI/SNF-related matrix-associated actin-dependent regulator of chromatin subfamily D